MSDPFTSIALAAFSLIGGLQQASAAEASARAAEDQARTEAERERREGRRRIGLFRARTGASGLMLEGAPLEVLSDAAAEVELAAREAIYRGAVHAQQSRNQGRIDLFRGIRGAGTTLLQTDFGSPAGPYAGASYPSASYPSASYPTVPATRLGPGGRLSGPV